MKRIFQILFLVVIGFSNSAQAQFFKNPKVDIPADLQGTESLMVYSVDTFGVGIYNIMYYAPKINKTYFYTLVDNKFIKGDLAKRLTPNAMSLKSYPGRKNPTYVITPNRDTIVVLDSVRRIGGYANGFIGYSVKVHPVESTYRIRFLRPNGVRFIDGDYRDAKLLNPILFRVRDESTLVGLIDTFGVWKSEMQWDLIDSISPEYFYAIKNRKTSQYKDPYLPIVESGRKDFNEKYEGDFCLFDSEGNEVKGSRTHLKFDRNGRVHDYLIMGAYTRWLKNNLNIIIELPSSWQTE